MGILQRRGEQTDIDGLKLPKYGALKVGEIQEQAQLSREWPELSKGLTTGQQAIEMTLQCITLILKRIDPEWTIEKTRAKEWTLPMDGKEETFEPDSVLTDELYKFYQGERDRWPEPDAPAKEEEPAEPGKKPTGKTSTGGSRKRSRAAKTSKA